MRKHLWDSVFSVTLVWSGTVKRRIFCVGLYGEDLMSNKSWNIYNKSK